MAYKRGVNAVTQPEPRIEPRSPIAIIRLDDLSQAILIARALEEGGIRALEFTLTNAGAVDAIGRVKAEMPAHVLVGAGTVLEADEARRCIEAGADFWVTPAFLPEVV